ncbi:MAG: threonylcarbamoyl-AMP synthase [Candidatus Anammoximicrobium sp.]|nr:threonylcarbamoyl-AMP synthase [Candidatus Anammoximicrobium sp.]
MIHLAVQALSSGKLVAFPTETVYGVAADALNEAAVSRLLTIKGRRPGQPLTLAAKNAEEALKYCPDVSRVGQRLGIRCWPGPLTLVLPGNHPRSVLHRLPGGVRQAVAPAEFVGLRVPDHRLLLETLRLLPAPVTLTSANRSGQPDAVSAQEVVDALGDDVDLVLSDGRSKYAQPSSVVRVQGQTMEVLRQGVLSESALQRFASLIVLLVCTGNTCRSPMAQVMFQQRVAQKLRCDVADLPNRGVMVISAGVSAADGMHASEQAVEAMRARGLDLTNHESRRVSDSLVRFADLILAMTLGHRDAILQRWPEAAGKIQLIRQDGLDVADPIGGDVAEYEVCAAQLERHLSHWIGQLEPASLPVFRNAT